MRVIDTSVWFAFIDKDDSQRLKAEAFFSALEWNSVLLPDFVYYEILTVIKVKAPNPSEALEYLSKLIKTIGIQIVQIEKRFLQLAEQNIFRIPGKFSFVDMILFTYSQEGYEIMTFDKKLEALIQAQKA